jgi:hypothetical protein
MGLTRKIVVSVVGLFFMACLMVVLGHWILAQTVLDAGFAKQTLRDAGTYKDAAKTIVTPQLVTQLDSFESGQKLITSAMIQAAAEKSFSNQFIQTNTEKIVDITEAWLNSNRADLSYEIPIKAQTDQFYTELESQLTAKIKTLPDCRSYSVDKQQLLQSQCLPWILTVNQAVAEIMTEVKAHSPYSDTLTETSVSISDQQHQATAHLPDYIGYLWLANTLALGLAGLLFVILIWSGRWYGTIVVGVVAILVAVITLIVVAQLPAIERSLQANVAADSLMQAIMQSASKGIARFSQMTALALGGIGIIIAALGVLWWRLSQKH